MTPNGFIVQGLGGSDGPWIPEGIGYRGLGWAATWPLGSRTVDPEPDPIACALHAEADEEWNAYQEIVEASPGLGYVGRYLAHCQRVGIETRVLLCETDCHLPSLDPQTREAFREHQGFLGYELSERMADVSYVAEEVFSVPEFAPYRQRLNRFGLFDTEEALDEYVAARDIALATGVTIEPSGAFTKFLLYEIRAGAVPASDLSHREQLVQSLLYFIQRHERSGHTLQESFNDTRRFLPHALSVLGAEPRTRWSHEWQLLEEANASYRLLNEAPESRVVRLTSAFRTLADLLREQRAES